MDVIGLSLLSGAHNILFPKVVVLLKEKNAGDIIVMGGGVIPEEDISYLKEKGVQAVFTSGTKIGEIVDFINDKVEKRNK